MTSVAILGGKITGAVSKKLRLGAGVTWAGEVGLWLDRGLIPKLIPRGAKVVLVAGTNGKTTTAKLLKTALENAGKKVVLNQSGANLLNGIAGTLLQNPSGEVYIFEVDENNLPLVLWQVHPESIILLNLFRDQLDRYGEVDAVAKKWQSALSAFDRELIVNADDPQMAWIGKNYLGHVRYFGLGDKSLYLKQMQHATDSIFCPGCGSRLRFSGVYFSHVGEYSCSKCGFRHPKNNITRHGVKDSAGLEGIYNLYNVMAASLAAKELGLQKVNFSGFKPAFGRSEEIGRTKILLSKNPAGFNESLRTVVNSKRRGPVYLVLNDRIPDGRDVSWIWDVDFEMLKDYEDQIFVGGDRALDLAVRLKYAEVPFSVGEKFDAAWILPTYSAMLDVRKMLTGRKIL